MTAGVDEILVIIPACLLQAGRVTGNQKNTSLSFQRKLACMDARGRAASGTGRRGIQWFKLSIAACLLKAGGNDNIPAGLVQR